MEDGKEITQDEILEALDEFHDNMFYTLLLLSCAGATSEMLIKKGWGEDTANRFARRMIGRAINLFGEYVKDPELLKVTEMQ